MYYGTRQSLPTIDCFLLSLIADSVGEQGGVAGMQSASSFLTSLGVSDLDVDELELCQAAKEFAENAYAPYSDFHVGAAVRMSDGQVFGGANMENACYGLGICAEVAALASANTATKEKVYEIAVYGRNASSNLIFEDLVLPCGRCRQLIHEASVRAGRDIKILSCNEEMNRFARTSISELLPAAFGPGNLGKIIEVGQEESELVDTIQASLGERAQAFLKKEAGKAAQERLGTKPDEPPQGIFQSISNKFRKRRT